MPSFKYVYVPWDKTQSCEERSLVYDEEKIVESLSNELKVHFARQVTSAR